MKRYLALKNIVTALLITFIYASNLVDGCAVISRVIGTLAIFCCMMFVFSNVDKAIIEKAKEKKNANR